MTKLCHISILNTYWVPPAGRTTVWRSKVGPSLHKILFTSSCSLQSCFTDCTASRVHWSQCNWLLSETGILYYSTSTIKPKKSLIPSRSPTVREIFTIKQRNTFTYWWLRLILFYAFPWKSNTTNNNALSLSLSTSCYYPVCGSQPKARWFLLKKKNLHNYIV